MKINYQTTATLDLSDEQIIQLEKVERGGHGWSNGDEGDTLDTIERLGLVSCNICIGTEIYHLTRLGETILQEIRKETTKFKDIVDREENMARLEYLDVWGRLDI